MTAAQIFTVIIPTLNRAETLESTIKTCLAQDDLDLRVIVSDNASEDNTHAVVSSFSDPRLRYINPGSRLGMSEHWEFALGHVEPGYVTVLGDDDALLPNAVATARSLLSDLGAKALTWQKVEYCWPDHILPDYKNWLYIPLSTGVETIATQPLVREVLDFRAPYNRLPCIYNSFISTDVINEYKAKNDGIFFGSITPDIYSAFATASVLDNFLFSSAPLSINGGSSKSNGTLHTQGKRDNAISKSFVADTAFKFEPGLPYGRVIEIAVLDAFYKVAKTSPAYSHDWVDNSRVVQSALANAAAGIRSDEAYEDWIEIIRQFSEHHGHSEQFSSAFRGIVRNPDAGKLPTPGIYTTPPAIVVDASTLGIKDVHAAALRTAEILELKASQPELFEKLAATRNPVNAISLFARARGAPLRLHLGCGYAYFEGYVNVDYPQTEHSVMTVKPDVFCDVMQIDLPDGVVEEVRLQHVFEHFNRTVALASVIKWQRWLRIGGKLHIETPDFKASAQDFMSADTLEAKLRAIRHLEGDQADGWAYHVGQWFPARFRKTFEQLGFEHLDIRQETSGHTPPLFNVTAIGFKAQERSSESQYQAGCLLLRDFMVAEAEQPTWEVWTRQLARALDFKEFPTPSINHPQPLPASAMVQGVQASEPIEPAYQLPREVTSSAFADDAAPNAEAMPHNSSFRGQLRSKKLAIRRAVIAIMTIILTILVFPLILLVAAFGAVAGFAGAIYGVWRACSLAFRLANSLRLGRQDFGIEQGRISSAALKEFLAKRSRGIGTSRTGTGNLD